MVGSSSTVYSQIILITVRYFYNDYRDWMHVKVPLWQRMKLIRKSQTKENNLNVSSNEFEF